MVSEKRKTQMKLYIENHKAEIKKQKKLYYEKNKEGILKKAKIERDKFENKEKQKIYMKAWYQRNKEFLSKKNKLRRQQPEVKAKNKAYEKKRQQTPERQKQDRNRNKEPKRKAWGKKFHRRYQRHRRQTDEEFRIIHNLRVHFHKAMTLYSSTGKKMPSNEYEIDFEAIFKHLGEKPNDKYIYEADHIIPLSMFDHNDPKQIKKAWAPENFQWLTREINQWKGNRLIKPLTNAEKEKLQAELIKNN